MGNQISLTQFLVSFLALVIGIVAFAWVIRRRKDDFVETNSSPKLVDDYVNVHGDPIDVVVLDVTRSNELCAVVLVYDHELVINGETIDRSTVTGVTFNNAANPYVGGDYQLVFSTSNPDKPTIKTPVGNDAGWASEVATQMAQYI